MKKKVRFAVILGAVLITMMGVTGCMGRKEHMEKEMLAHMYEKYGVEFEVQEFVGRGIDCSYDVWYCTAKGDDPETDQIEVHRWNSGEDEEYRDNYFGRLVRDELEGRVEQVLNNKIDTYKVYMYSDRFVGEQYDSTEDIGIYLEEQGEQITGFFFKIMVENQGDDSSNEDYAKEIMESLKTANVGNSYVRIFFMESDIFEERTRSNSRKLYKSMNGRIMYVYDYVGEIYEGE